MPRPVRYNALKPAEIPKRVAELETRSPHGCGTAIQVSLPPQFSYNGNFSKCIGSCFLETDSFADTGWPRHCNLVDELWLPCRHNKEAAEASGVTVPIKVIPCAVDEARFSRGLKPLPIRKEKKDSFLFYTVGESTRRKNFSALVQAFHLEFDPHEPVELVIKTAVPGMKPGPASRKLYEDFEVIKTGLNLYQDTSYYKREVLLTEPMSEEEIDRLHQSCDCYVSAAYGEGWGVPAHESMGYGNPTILSACSGHLDFATEETSWLVPGHKVPVMAMTGHDRLYTGKQCWFSTDILELRKAMREAYECKSLRDAKGRAGLSRALDFSHEKVGRLMRQALES